MQERKEFSVQSWTYLGTCGTLTQALLLVLFVQMQIIFLYKCFIISCACLQHTALLQQQKVQQQRPCQPKKTHTNLYAHTHTHRHTTAWFTENSAYSIFWQGVQDKEFRTCWLLCGYATDTKRGCCVCVHPQFASTQHPVHLSGNETAVTLIRFLLPNLKDHFNC